MEDSPVQQFQGDLAGYKAWATAHHSGYVLNVRSANQPAMLHRTPCGHVFPAREEYGDFTRKRKVCADDRTAVEAWAARHGVAIALCSSCDV